MLKGDLITGLIYRNLAQAYSHLQASALMGDSISRKEKKVLILARDLERREEKKARQLYTRRHHQPRHPGRRHRQVPPSQEARLRGVHVHVPAEVPVSSVPSRQQ
jgi:hypothetical protein